MDILSFKHIKTCLQNGDTTPLKDIFETYSTYCIRELQRKRFCSREDAEDIYIDSILNLRDKIVSDKLDMLTNVKGYLLSTCFQMHLARIKKYERIERAENDFQNTLETVAFEFDSDKISNKELMLQLTEGALNTIGARCMDLLKSFYFDKLSMEGIAEKFNLANQNAAKVSKARCFQKLVDEIKIGLELNRHKNDVDF